MSISTSGHCCLSSQVYVSSLTSNVQQLQQGLSSLSSGATTLSTNLNLAVGDSDSHVDAALQTQITSMYQVGGKLMIYSRHQAVCMLAREQLAWMGCYDSHNRNWCVAEVILCWIQ